MGFNFELMLEVPCFYKKLWVNIVKLIVNSLAPDRVHTQYKSKQEVHFKDFAFLLISINISKQL